MELYNQIKEYDMLLQDGVISTEQFLKLKMLLYKSITGEDGVDDVQVIDRKISEEIYSEVSVLLEKRTKEAYAEAIPVLEYIGTWKNTEPLLEQCKTELRIIEEQEKLRQLEEKLEKHRQLEEELEKAREKERAERLVDNEQAGNLKRSCPNCGTETMGKFCPKCGTQIPEESRTAEAGSFDRQSPEEIVEAKESKDRSEVDVPTEEPLNAHEFEGSQVVVPASKPKNKIVVIGAAIAAVLLIAILAFGGAGSGPSLETYIEQNDAVRQAIQTMASSDGSDVSIDGNHLYFTFDLALMGEYTEADVTSDAVVEQLESLLDENASDVGLLCAQLEEEADVKGVRITFSYNYGDKVIVSRTFDSSDA